MTSFETQKKHICKTFGNRMRSDFPLSLQNCVNIGIVETELDNLSAAKVAFQTALSVEPGYSDAHFNIANILQDLGQLDGAVQSYQKTIKINQDNTEAHYELGLTFMKLGKVDASIKSYEK